MTFIPIISTVGTMTKIACDSLKFETKNKEAEDEIKNNLLNMEEGYSKIKVIHQ